jgi:hypothetical protein
MAARDLAAELLRLSESPTAELRAALADVLAPGRAGDAPHGADPVAEVRAGRERLVALLVGPLVGERLVAALGAAAGRREEVESLLNAPFPPRQPISVEFLDLLVARVESLESCVRLLAGALAEVLYPSDRDVPSVSVSSAGGRRHA